MFLLCSKMFPLIMNFLWDHKFSEMPQLQLLLIGAKSKNGTLFGKAEGVEWWMKSLGKLQHQNLRGRRPWGFLPRDFPEGLHSPPYTQGFFFPYNVILWSSRHYSILQFDSPAFVIHFWNSKVIKFCFLLHAPPRPDVVHMPMHVGM